MHSIERVTEADLPELLPLMRGYCDFYNVSPTDEALLTLARALLENPEHEGVQLIARNADDSTAVGFATIYWSWSTSSAARIGVMNDLYVADSARGRGLADELIAGCTAQCVTRGAVELEWCTVPDNYRAQSVYDRIGGRRERWINYSLPC
jgi:ribosomal protein S18 acetylase RimI-like enzyme